MPSPDDPASAPKPKNPPHYPAHIKRQIRELSLIGHEDKDLSIRFNVPRLTIRTWRKRDKPWSLAYHHLRQGETGGRAPKAVKELEAQRKERERQEAETYASQHPDKPRDARTLHATTSPGIDLLPDIAARNHVRAAVIADRALERVEKRKKPLTLNTIHEVAAAYKVIRLANGDDTEGGPPITLNLWGSAGSAITQGGAPAFREVGPPKPAIPEPAPLETSG
jgi:hypothetical protein